MNCKQVAPRALKLMQSTGSSTLVPQGYYLVLRTVHPVTETLQRGHLDSVSPSHPSIHTLSFLYLPTCFHKAGREKNFQASASLYSSDEIGQWVTGWRRHQR